MKDIDAFYYGYGDEDDAVIVPLEKEQENEGNAMWLPGLFSHVYAVLNCQIVMVKSRILYPHAPLRHHLWSYLLQSTKELKTAKQTKSIRFKTLVAGQLETNIIVVK